jgi:hypothetical protein
MLIRNSKSKSKCALGNICKQHQRDLKDKESIMKDPTIG